MKQSFDVIVVLGYRFENEWILPEFLLHGLKRAADLYLAGSSPKIALCGKWNLRFDHEKIIPPTTEAEKMRVALLKLGVPNEAIIKEEESKDTIGNAYFLKKQIIEPMQMKSILVICADFHLKRARYIFQKIFGDKYEYEFEGINTNADESVFKIQEETYVVQKTFLTAMKDGDDTYLKERLYSDPYYSPKQM